jgi:phosphohistidine phosphatase
MSVEVIFVRHAIAAKRSLVRWKDDRQRPLTSEGRRKFRKAAARLATWVPRVDCLLTSPLVRARQTAEVLNAVARWPNPIDCPELAPGSDPGAVLAILRRQKAKRIALVGHEPDLSGLLSLCIAGPDVTLPIALKKGGIACIVFSRRVGASKATLTAIIPPRALRAK